MRSHVNLSAIIRAAGCAGLARVVATGNAKVVDRVAREGAEHVTVVTKNSLAPALKKLKAEGYTLVALEQTTNSTSLCDFIFPKKCALVIGAERSGLSPECLALVEACVEIPSYGLPYSHNAATATAIAVYEYCRQHRPQAGSRLS
jgi:tRNA G18 (ribose-2'-O)-methylase SpoU